jgi:2-dehydro-3-deoxygalactonokinase
MNWNLAIVPGVAKLTEPVDVMRGEECQIFGSGVSDGWICLPGTHSKWMRVAEGKIVDFTTFMTGELFALLSQHGSLTTLVSGQVFDHNAFIAGLKNAGGLLTQQLFGIRARAVLDKTDFADSQSYLSGLLIGQEFRAAMAMKERIKHFHLVAAPQLTDLYAIAALHFGMECEVMDIEAVTRNGLIKVLKGST